MTMECKSKEQEKCEELFPAFDFDEFNKLSYSEMCDFQALLDAYIVTTEEAMKASPFKGHDFEDLKDPYICLSLEEAINDIDCGCITDWDGNGCWHLYDAKEDKHYFGQENLSCGMLQLFCNDYIDLGITSKSTEEDKKKAADYLIKLLHEHFDRYGLEIVGIMWYNK